MLHLYDLSACFFEIFYKLHLSTNDLLEGTRESVWTCACPRFEESGIGAELERNRTIALAFGLKPALRFNYISHASLPAPSAHMPCYVVRLNMFSLRASLTAELRGNL